METPTEEEEVPGEVRVRAEGSDGLRYSLPEVAPTWTSMEGHTEAVCAVAWCGETGRLFTGSYDGSLRAWDGSY